MTMNTYSQQFPMTMWTGGDTINGNTMPYGTTDKHHETMEIATSIFDRKNSAVAGTAEDVIGGSASLSPSLHQTGRRNLSRSSSRLRKVSPVKRTPQSSQVFPSSQTANISAVRTRLSSLSDEGYGIPKDANDQNGIAGDAEEWVCEFQRNRLQRSTNIESLPQQPIISRGFQYEEPDDDFINGLLFFAPNSQRKIESIYEPDK